MAICAWDGELTYGELDDLSTGLAHELIDLGVRPGTIVPLCFQKSMWVPVSKLAVMKAGGASVTMDPTQPEERLKSVVQQVGSHIILSGTSTSSLASAIAGRPAFVVCSETLPRTRSLPAAESQQETELPVVKPTDLLYLVFTSGSTGVPKGAMMTHSNFATATKHHAPALGFKKTSRVADFASYAFDVSWANFLNTMAAGGCLCIPSEEDRQHDFVGFMSRFRVNYVDLTPSVAALLDLNLVPQLETVVVGGELVELDKLQHLQDLESLIITYGPAECTVTATAVDVRKLDVPSSSIGSACGATTWVIDPEKNVLLPVGSVGELVLEGPLNGLGYLNDPDKTAAAFIEDPQWLKQGAPGVPGRRGRLYRTGDLVRYHSDGSLIFIGRQDSQVKIRGQRVDLSEIEFHVRKLLPAEMSVHVVAEVVMPQAAKSPMLVVFFTMTGVEDMQEMQEKFAPVLEDLERRLARQLPAFMLPGAYVPIANIPISATGKTDRRAVREYGASLDPKALSARSKSHSGEHIEPVTAAEKKLQLLWGSVLGIAPSQISADDSFMRLGGDSITAMRLAAAARQSAISLTVAQILKHPQLNELAKVIEQQQDEQQDDMEQQDEVIGPFSLLKASVSIGQARQDAAELCSVDAAEIEDVFPCTALQEGLVAMTARRAGDYVQRTLLELKPEVDLGRFRLAWEDVFVMAPILRTRIVNLEGQGLVQVVLRKPLLWKHSNSIDTYQREERDEEYHQRSMSLGAPLTTFGIIDDTANDKRYFAWTQHHATYDGWSLKLLYDAFEQTYQNKTVDTFTAFQPFIKYVLGQIHDDEAVFWKKQFSGLDAPQFPEIPARHQPQADKALEHSINSLQWPAGDVTASSTLRAAWATLLSWYGASPDTVFGAVVLGRQAPVPNIEKLAGPTIATVPIRILVDGDLSVQEFLLQTQSQATDMIQFEQTGLQNISRLNEDAQRGCQFQTLLIVQSAETSDNTMIQSSVFETGIRQDEATTPDVGGLVTGELDAFSTYAITLTCEIEGPSVRLLVRFDSKVITTQEVQRLVQQLEHVLRQLCQPRNATSNVKMGDLDMVSQQDLGTIWNWNATVPETVEGCVHHIFDQRVRENPTAPAVCAWDGELSYNQLDDLSSRLAHHLIDAGVKPGVIVPLYFKKSVWVPVAILAIMKAGGAGVTLDATLPVERLRGIVQQVSPILMLNSAVCQDLAPQITSAPTLTVDEALLKKLETQETGAQLPPVDPNSPLYIVFTSGSTGLPKGAIMTHSNFCSSAKHHQQPLGLEATSRVFEFTSYAFDVAWSNILHALTVGGCLCIPSEEDRITDIAGSIARLGANFVHLTPTVANILDPSALPGLEKILFTGEALKRADVTRWRSNNNVQFYNTYGPAECTVTSTVEAISPYDDHDPSIGKPYGTLAWVVKPDAKSLAAIGTAGELWIEGPTVGAGYLDNPEKTSYAFVESPEWLLQGGAGVPGRHGRLYRTGDMVRYNPDGSIFFIGRKDTQVKVRGQRVELGEVDYHVRQLLPSEVKQVATEIITPHATMTPILAVFLTISGTLSAEQLDEKAAPLISSLKGDLVKRVPPYMVPSAYIPLPELPMTASGKTDRRALGELGKAYIPPSITELSEQPLSDVTLTKDESSLREIWAGLLNIDRDLISPKHSFSGLGGDSIKTMSLVMAIRKQWNLNIQIPRLLGPQDTLCDMAKLITRLQQGQDVVKSVAMDVEKELASLTDKLRSPLCLAPVESKTTVLLTGSTGFLGIQILRQVLTTQLFGRTVLLVRCANDFEGLHRVREAAKVAGWWEESFTSAIEVWEGDLSAERLGLTDARWSSLCGEHTSSGVVDAIIHNGAVVHWSTDYDQLKAVNVGSTLQLLQAAMHSKALRRFVYVSGGLSASDWANSTADVASQATGYDQSKYISERLVTAAAAQRGEERSKFSIVKPGLIIGDSEDGVANPDDFLWRVVTTAIRLQARPTEAPKSWLAISDVASVSGVVLHHATADDVDHFVELRRGMWVESFWAAVEGELQQPMQSVSWDAWIELAQQDISREGELHPLWPVQQFLGTLGSEPTGYSPECTLEASQMDEAVRMNVKYLRGKGLVGVLDANWHQATAKVTMRSRRQA